MTIRTLPSVPATTVLLFLCSLGAACGLRTYGFEPPARHVENRHVYPWRVGVVVHKKFMPYKVKFRYWSSTSFKWPIEGLPDAYVRTLSSYFLSVEPLSVGGTISTGRHDLIARMSVDQLHFNGANTTVSDDKVDVTMTFTVEQPDGTGVFRSTVSATASSPYIQRCAFCRPDPPEAFTEAFRTVFAKLYETLSFSDIRIPS